MTTWTRKILTRERLARWLWLAALSVGASIAVRATANPPLWVFAVIGVCIGLASW